VVCRFWLEWVVADGELNAARKQAAPWSGWLNLPKKGEAARGVSIFLGGMVWVVLVVCDVTLGFRKNVGLRWAATKQKKKRGPMGSKPELAGIGGICDARSSTSQGCRKELVFGAGTANRRLVVRNARPGPTDYEVLPPHLSRAGWVIRRGCIYLACRVDLGCGCA
jgi:hypothetical protein